MANKHRKVCGICDEMAQGIYNGKCMKLCAGKC